MRRLLPLLVLLLLPAGALAQDFDAEGEVAMLDRMNAIRTEASLAALARLPELDAVARAHSAEMARTGQLTHVSDATGTPEDRVRAAGVEAGTILENVAFHHDTANAQAALLASPAHRGNMLSPAITHVGLAAVRTERGVYVTQVFAELRAAAPPAVAAAPEAPAEAPAEAATPTEAAPSFELIPPFVERVAGAAAEAVTPPADGTVDDEGQDAAAQGPITAPEASEPAAADVASADEAPADAAPAPVSSGDALTLRRLLGMAQSLLDPNPH